MRTQSQFTIYSINDVVTSATAPTSPYKGQLWVNTGKTPPVTMVWSGSAWVEQNGTDTLKSSITTLTTKQATFQTNLDGLTSTVSKTTEKVETLESGIGDVETAVLEVQNDVSVLEQTASSLSAKVTTNTNNISSLSVTVSSISTRVSTAEGNITSLMQTTSSISASVENKADKTYGSSSSSFGWSLTSTGFFLYSNASTVMSVNNSGLSVKGAITATSGTLENMTITGKLYFGGDTSYYISANYNDSNYYIYLPGLRIDKASTAVFFGKLSAPSGTIGGFTISTAAIYKTKSSYSSTTAGVYIGTDGIGLGAGTFYVTSAGKLYATDAEISGKITCGEGTIGGFTIGSSSLTNTTGGSYIQITSGNYVTRLGANSVYAQYTTSSGTQGWGLGLDKIQISASTSSVFSGVKISPTYTKRTSTTALSSTTVKEGCITSVKVTYYNADSSTTVSTGSPFIIGMSREYADSPYAPFHEWGAYARFVDYNLAELVYDSAYSGIWQLRNVSGSTYNLVDLIPYIASHKFYVWQYTSAINSDSVASCTKTTHGLSTINGAIVVPRSTATSTSGLSGYSNITTGTNRYGVTISGTTVYVCLDDGKFVNGFYCIIFGS